MFSLATPTIESAVAVVAGSDVESIKSAESYLNNERTSNLNSYLLELAHLLNDASKSEVVRSFSSLLLKNALTSKDEEEKSARQEQWIALGKSTRDEIKSIYLATLKDDQREVTHKVAQVRRTREELAIGVIAAIEIPRAEWTLIQTLSNNVTQSNGNALKVASLDALSSVCEECESKLESVSDLILTAIGCALSTQETDTNMKLAAIQCLLNVIPFISTNMLRSSECDIVMTFIFNAMASENEKLCIVGYKCLSKVAEAHYQCLPRFITPIFQQTTKAIASRSDEIVTQAIEFWSSIAEVELEASEGDVSEPSFHFIKQSAAHLIPILLQCLTRQKDDEEEVDDSGELSVSLAAATCLGLCASVSGDTVASLVLPFIAANCRSTEWKSREAAIMAFGCLLDAPNKSELTEVSKSGVSMVLAGTKDPHPRVKDSSMWVIGRILQHTPDAIEPTSYPALIDVFVVGLTQSPKIVVQVCWAIHNLAQSLADDADGTDADEEEGGPLTPYFSRLIDSLLAALNRLDIGEDKMRVGIYEAINILVEISTPVEEPRIVALLSHLMLKLPSSLTSSDESDLEDVALLCGLLAAIISKLPEETIAPHTPQLMQYFLRLLSSSDDLLTVREECFLAISNVADKVQTEFAEYLPSVMPHLLTSLTRGHEMESKVACQCIGTIANAIGDKFIESSERVIRALVGTLSIKGVQFELKVVIVSTLGEIAAGVGAQFETHLPLVIPQMILASQVACDPTDLDAVDSINQLRANVLSTYSTILHGLNSGSTPKVRAFYEYPTLMDSILTFFRLVSSSGETTTSLLRNACELAFDVVSIFGQPIRSRLPLDAIKRLCLLAEQDEDPNTQHAGREARRVCCNQLHAS